MVYDVRFTISQDLALGSGTRLDYSELLCGRRTEKASDIDIRRGQRVPLSLVLARELYGFSIGYYGKPKECLKAVKVLPGPLPQFIF